MRKKLCEKDYLELCQFLKTQEMFLSDGEFVRIKNYSCRMFLVNHFPISVSDHIKLLFFWNDKFLVCLSVGLTISLLAIFDYAIYLNFTSIIFLEIKKLTLFFGIISSIFFLSRWAKKIVSDSEEKINLVWSRKSVPVQEKVWLEDESILVLKRKEEISQGSKVKIKNQTNNMSDLPFQKNRSYKNLFVFINKKSEGNSLFQQNPELLRPYLQLYFLDLNKVSFMSRLKQQVLFNSYMLAILCLIVTFNFIILTCILVDNVLLFF